MAVAVLKGKVVTVTLLQHSEAFLWVITTMGATWTISVDHYVTTEIVKRTSQLMESICILEVL